MSTRVQQRASQHADTPAAVLLRPPPGSLILTEETRKAVKAAVKRARPRLPEKTIRVFLDDLSDDIYEAKFGIDVTPALDTIKLRKRLDRFAPSSPTAASASASSTPAPASASRRRSISRRRQGCTTRWG